jgi:hypothetical protein
MVLINMFYSKTNWCSPNISSEVLKDVFWAAALHGLVDIDKRSYHFGGCNHLWNIGQRLPDYKLLHTKKTATFMKKTYLSLKVTNITEAW